MKGYARSLTEEGKTYEGEPRKDEVEHLIDQLDVYPQLTRKRMRPAIDEVEVEGTVNGGEERTVEPSSPLRDELRHLVRYVCHSIRRLDVV